MEARDRVVVRYLRAMAIANPIELHRTLSQNLEGFCKWENEARQIQQALAEIKKIQAADPSSPDQKPFWDKVDLKALREIGRAVTYTFIKELRDTWDLALAILQQLVLPPNLRRKMEQASKYWAPKLNKPFRVRLKGSQLDQADTIVSTYLDQITIAREQLAAALEALAKGKPIGEDDKIKAGPFSLVNTGSFNEKVLSDVADVVQKAAKLITAKGFGRICYGDILVSKKVGRATVLAFYLKDSDEMFVRAGVRLSVDSLHTVLHELGHRLRFKFLASKTKELDAVYNKYKLRKDLGRDKGEIDKSLLPAIGEEVQYKGDTLVVNSIDLHNRKIRFVLKDEPKGSSFSTDIDTFAVMFKGVSNQVKVNPLGFVTQYAGKDPDENFAEMFAYYCTDELTAEQVEDLKRILE